jgi:hypothetical protein
VTDEHDDLPTDADADAVRRLLADARHPGPMPDDVAARMDAVLAELSAGRDEAAAPGEPVVVFLPAQRRRRAAALLVAAAAIVVGGVAVAQQLPRTSSQSGASASASDRTEDNAQLGSSGARSRQPSASGPAGLDQRVRSSKIRDGRVLVRPQHFTSDALAARQVAEQLARREAPVTGYLTQSDVGCVTARTHGARVNATYQRAPALLVFHPPGSGSQVVDLYVCGSERPVRSTTLPSP